MHGSEQVTSLPVQNYGSGFRTVFTLANIFRQFPVIGPVTQER